MIRELGLFAATLADRAMNAIAPPSPFIAADQLARDEEAYEVAEPVGEYPPIAAEQFRPDVPAGGVDAAALTPQDAADKSAAGGHSPEATSELLADAINVLRACYLVVSRDDLEYRLIEDRVLDLLPRLRDRAAQLAAHGD